MPKLIDLTGQTFGLWTVLEKAPSQKGETMWLCKCNCKKQTIREVSGRNLRNGKTKSCGCVKRDQTENLIGQKFGHLTPIEHVGSQCGHALWSCECDCENHTKIIVAANHLKSGAIKSCGCMKRSYGEELIENLLKQNNIIYEIEKVFNNCKNNEKNCSLRFDFYVNNQYLIEFDGIQHFKSVDLFGGDKEFKKRKENDEIKNKYCKDNNIPLIRIPYTRLKNLCIEDLKLETSDFILL